MRPAPFLPPSAPRRRGESIVPMINVVFLLLIFFLMTAQIAPPDPFEVTLPHAAEGAAPREGAALHVGPDGALGFRDLRGDAALAAAVAEAGASPESAPPQVAADAEAGRVVLRADAALEASALAGLLARLAEAGASRVDVSVTPK